MTEPTLTARRVRWTNCGPGRAVGEQDVTVDGRDHLVAYAAVADDDAPGAKLRTWTITATTVIGGDIVRVEITRKRQARVDAASSALYALADAVRAHRAAALAPTLNTLPA